MANEVVGLTALQHRLERMSSTSARHGTMQEAAVFIRGQMVTAQREIGARKTGNTARSLQVTQVTETSASIVGTPVNVWIDTGTGLYGPAHRRITPRVKKALAFAVGSFGKGGSLRLTGRPRKGKAGAAAARVVVRSVAGMHARPYIARSITEAAKKLGAPLKAAIIRQWNGHD